MLRISWLFCIFRYSPVNKVWKPKWGNLPIKIWLRYKIFQKFILLWTVHNLVFLADFIRCSRLRICQKPWSCRTIVLDTGVFSVLLQRSPLWSWRPTSDSPIDDWWNIATQHTLPDILWNNDRPVLFHSQLQDSQRYP